MAKDKEAKRAKVIAAEQRQLRRLEAMKAKGSYKGYLLVILMLITLVNILDEISTSISGTVQSSYITEFFVNGTVFGQSYSYENGLALHTTISLVGYAIGLITPFYKALADRIGRKPLFVLSTLGMSVGLLITFFSPSYLMFMIGTGVTGFFIGHDIQIIYILEQAPSNSRGRIYSVLKSIGILGAVGVPLLRQWLMGDDATLWRRIFLLPALVGFVAVLLVLFFAKETRVYVEERSEYLARPYEEREAERLEKKESAKKTGVFKGIKYIFTHAETRPLVIAHIIFDTAIVAVALYYESIMHLSGMSTEQITQAIFVHPFIYAIATFLSGFIADRAGRKSTIQIGGALCFTAFVLFICSTQLHWNPYVVGLCFGLYQSGYWIGRDYMSIMLTEKVPTEIRASVIGAEGLLVTGGMAVGYAAVILGLLALPVWVTCLVICLPCVVVSIIIFSVKVKETKGVDLTTIKYE